MAECSGLLNRQGRKLLQGSNPCPSAKIERSEILADGPRATAVVQNKFHLRNSTKKTPTPMSKIANS